MPEGRMLKKVISTSLKVAKLKSDSARLLYTWLIPHLDIEGRFSADPNIVKGYIVPRLKMSSRKIAEYLEDMANNDLIVLYEVDGDKFLQLNKFKKFQLLNPKREAKSLIPKITPELNPINSNTIKVKESKVKESKVKKSKYIHILDFWNSKEIIIHKPLKPLIEQIESALKKYGKDKIIQAIENYSKIHSDEKYFYRHIWRLDKFLKQSNGLPNFLEDGQTWINYIKENKPIRKPTYFKAEDDEKSTPMPPEFRKKMDKALKKIDAKAKNFNG